MASKEFGLTAHKVGVLIPTRNRPQKVRKLLASLVRSTIQPTQVVIVSSGDEISEVLNEFSSLLIIKYEHSASYGQANQKKIGVKLLEQDLDWVVFLDDDLVVHPNCIENALRDVFDFEISSNNRVTGVGLALPPTSRALKSNGVLRWIGRAFLISNTKPGVVSKSGHAASYLESKEILPTQWLNGASMWRRNSINFYGKDLISTKYAACEDLIFSHSRFQGNNLIYSPNALITFQEDEVTNFESSLVFETAALWRLYFVMTNRGFSRTLFLYSQIGRTLFGVMKTDEYRLHFLWRGLVFWVRLVFLSMSRTKLENTLKSV
jgi:glycosyltransferase involved in cell wall biosynthesis